MKSVSLLQTMARKLPRTTEKKETRQEKREARKEWKENRE